MGNYCSSSSPSLKNSEVEELTALLTRSDSSIEFNKHMDALQQYDHPLTKSRTTHILKILYDVIVGEKKFKHKFFALAFTSTMVKRHESFRNGFARSALVKVVLKHLKDESIHINDYLTEERVKLWRERYFSIAVELLAQLVHQKVRNSKKYATFFKSLGINIDSATFYMSLDSRAISEIKSRIGILTRTTTKRSYTKI